MGQVTPSYGAGDRVELYGEVFEVAEVQREAMPGYWLRSFGKVAIFLPLDLEAVLRPTPQ